MFHCHGCVKKNTDLVLLKNVDIMPSQTHAHIMLGDCKVK